MSKNTQSIKSVESNTWVGDPESKPTIVYLCIGQNGEGLDREYKTYRDVLFDCDDIQALIWEWFKKCEGWEKCDDDDFANFGVSELNSAATELGYRILKVIK